MKINFFSATFWFNIFTDHNDILKALQNFFREEYSNYNVNSYSDNYLNPVITAVNNKKMTNFSFSQINMQYNMDKVELNDYDSFKNKILDLFNLLTSLNIEILHTSIYINGELEKNDALKTITKNIVSSKICDNDLVDVSLRFGKKEEDLFYKIINVLNKKQIKLPKKIDELGRIIPIPLISWNEAYVENEILEISYEINDKYLFDYTKNYHTTEFYLNKMLYLLYDNFESDINSILSNGKF